MTEATPDGKQAIVKRNLAEQAETYDAVDEVVETDERLILTHTDGSTSVEYCRLVEYHQLGHDVTYHPLANSGRALDVLTVTDDEGGDGE